MFICIGMFTIRSLIEQAYVNWNWLSVCLEKPSEQVHVCAKMNGRHSDEKEPIDIWRWRKENWWHRWVRMDCMVNSCQGKDAGVLFWLNLNSPRSNVGVVQIIRLDGAENIINVGKVNTITCMYCCSLSQTASAWQGWLHSLFRMDNWCI